MPSQTTLTPRKPKSTKAKAKSPGPTIKARRSLQKATANKPSDVGFETIASKSTDRLMDEYPDNMSPIDQDAMKEYVRLQNLSDSPWTRLKETIRRTLGI